MTALDAALHRITDATDTLSDAYWTDPMTASRMSNAINVITEAVAAIRSEGAAEPGRPPLDPETLAHDKAYMAGLIRGREKASLGGGPAQSGATGPTTPDTSPDGSQSSAEVTFGGAAEPPAPFYDLALGTRADQEGGAAVAESLDVERVKQAVTNIAKRHDVIKDPPPPNWSLMHLYGYSTTPAKMDAEIATEYARLSALPEKPNP